MSVTSRPSPQQRAAILATTEAVELRIDKLVEGGDGLARLQGVPVLVPRSAPGDRLMVRLVERHPDYGRAEIEQVLEPGPGRREPPCPYFERCGGCDLQHLEDDVQAPLKVEAALETLRRLGRVEAPSHRLIRAEPWAYRLRAQLQIERGPSGPPRVGFHRRSSRDVVPVEHCAVLHPQLDRLLAEVRSAVSGMEQPPRRLDVACSQGRLSSAPRVEGLPHGELRMRAADLEYCFDARCFFQGHSSLAESLIEATIDAAGTPERGELAVDLYAGVGVFSLPLARLYSQVLAVEGDRVAARYARKNARKNRLRNLEVRHQTVESFLATSAVPRPDRVVVDPPRSGLSRPVRAWLLDRRPPRLTYVSCQPATLARDLRELSAAYGLDGLTFLDMFPQTGHLEVVTQLSLR